MKNKSKIKVKKILSKKYYTWGKGKENQTFSLDLQDEILSSTTHGLSYIFKPRIHFLERLFWIASFASSIVLMCLLLSAQYTRFVESPTVMSVEMNYFDWNISYPAITLCPVLKINVTLFNSLLNDTFHKTGLKADSLYWSVVAGGMDNLNFMNFNIPPNISSILHPNKYSRLAAELFRKFPNNSLTTNTNWAVSLETVITEVGMCHVINSNVAVYDNPLKWTRKNTEYAKTNVDLTIYEGDFLVQITNYSYNYKVYIHHPDELVLSTSPSFTFDMEGGILTVGLSVWSTRIAKEVRPMSTATRKCRLINEPLNKRYPVYSYNHCILECRIGIILQLCGCLPHFYKPKDTERVCSINELKCVLKYKKEIMSLSFPKNVLNRFPYKFPKLPRDCKCLSNCETDIYHKDSENFTYDESIRRLQIRITSFPKTRVVRDFIFHAYDILLRSGGVVNLFIGSSLLSIVELLMVVVKLIIFVAIHILKGINNVNT